MHVRVLPLPEASTALDGDVCVVVDVIRATTALVGLFEAGCARVYLSRSRSDAAKVRTAAGSECVLCAEQDDGLAPPGYDHEPSPAKLSRLDLRERVAVLATANGTPAALAAARQGAGLIVFAALRNLSAAADFAASQAAHRGCGITVVCSGRLGNSRIALEDIYCAGALVRHLARVTASNGWLDLDDSAVVAARMASAFAEPRAALLESRTGRRFVELGHEEDVLFCAAADASSLVPIVVAAGETAACPVELLDD